VVEQQEWAFELIANTDHQFVSHNNTIINMLCLYRIRRLLKMRLDPTGATNAPPIHVRLAEAMSTEANYLLHIGKKFIKQQVLFESEELVTPLHIKKQYLYRDNLNMIILEETDKPEQVVVKECHRVYLVSFEYKEHFINYRFRSMGSAQETTKTLELLTAKSSYASYSHLTDSKDKMLNFIRSFTSDINWDE